MGSLNVVILEGRFVAKPEWRGDVNHVILTFSLAQNRFFKLEGQPRTSTRFFPCVASGAVAKEIYEKADKGVKARVHGELDYRVWTDSSGRSARENPVHCNSIEWTSVFSPSKDGDEK